MGRLLVVIATLLSGFVFSSTARADWVGGLALGAELGGGHLGWSNRGQEHDDVFGATAVTLAVFLGPRLGEHVAAALALRGTFAFLAPEARLDATTFDKRADAEARAEVWLRAGRRSWRVGAGAAVAAPLGGAAGISVVDIETLVGPVLSASLCWRVAGSTELGFETRAGHLRGDRTTMTFVGVGAVVRFGSL